MLFLGQYLIGEQNVLIGGGTIFDNIDVCIKKYLFSTALHLLSVFFPTKMFGLIGRLEHLSMLNI